MPRTSTNVGGTFVAVLAFFAGRADVRADVPRAAGPGLETVKVSTIDHQGAIAVDGREVGHGDFVGPVPVGPHVVRVTRPGYDPFERPIFLRAGQPYVELVSLVPSVVVRPPEGGPDETMHGVYGGFRLNASFEPGGAKGNACSLQGATGCAVSPPVGAGLVGTMGYMLDPVGIEALFGVQGDFSSITATAEGETASVVVPRLGGILAMRVRLATQNAAARLSIAAGIGLSIRGVGLLAGGLATTAYVSPAVNLEAAVHLRLGATSAISLGMLFWGENAGQGKSLQIEPLPATVVVVHSTQTFLMPFLGVEVGP